MEEQLPAVRKGAQSRAGYSRKVGFEGGQMPIQRRLPKFGFNNPTRIEYKPINLSTIDALCTKSYIDKVDIETLRDAGLLAKSDLVKILWGTVN
jgi:large subunit ribosomal protein L15